MAKKKPNPYVSKAGYQSIGYVGRLVIDHVNPDKLVLLAHHLRDEHGFKPQVYNMRLAYNYETQQYEESIDAMLVE